VANTLLGNTPSLERLLTTSSFLEDSSIKDVTKAAGTGPLATGDTNDTGRQGLLMHPQVLAAHTKTDGFSPFQVGKFLRENVLCEIVKPPPNNANAIAPPDLPAGATLRENFQNKTGASAVCSGCHSQFAPLGYAFLPFDPVGRWTTNDPSGKPWDLAGS